MLKNKNKFIIVICLVFFLIFSIASIYSATLYGDKTNIISKQLMWYILGFLLIIFAKKIDFKIIYKYIPVLYIVFNVLLFLLLFFGKDINGSKCWFVIGPISFQPSEFMKLILIIYNAKILSLENKTDSIKDNIKTFMKVILITLLPSILTFLEPDTGMVLIYFLISFVMLFIHGLKKRIFIFLALVFILFMGLFLFYYFRYQDNFIKLFGTSFFYRIDRLLDWKNKSGMQLTNALASISAAKFFGYGIGNVPIYIPESHTDFIFSITSSSFGLFGSLILIFLIILFDYELIMLTKNSKDKFFNYITIGFFISIFYQQIQNIGMNIGILPITGITLPFISYGGSSLLGYMLMIAIILNYKSVK